MTKLHSFTVIVSLLNCGLGACNSGENEDAAAAMAATDARATSGTDPNGHAGHTATSGDAGVAGNSAGAHAGTGGGTDAERDAGGAAESGDDDAGAAAEDTQTDAGAAPGTFTHIYEKAFKTCRLQCHGMGFSMLDMKTRDAAYRSLVNQDSNPKNEACAKLGLKRVQPGDPDNSLLYLKLDIHAPCGQQMPPGGQLPQESRDEVRDWIAAGAPDN